MSANHGGSLENALTIIREVTKAGADCLKNQTYTAGLLTIDFDNKYFKIKRQNVKNVGWIFLSIPFDNDGVDFLESLGVEAYKIASFELVDIPLIEYTASWADMHLGNIAFDWSDNISAFLRRYKNIKGYS